MKELLLNRRQRQKKRLKKDKPTPGYTVPLAERHLKLYEGLLDIAALDTRSCIDPKRKQGRPKAAAAKLASQQLMFSLGVELTTVYNRVGNLCKLVRSAID